MVSKKRKKTPTKTVIDMCSIFWGSYCTRLDILNYDNYG